jgi:hypothetical protein
MNQLEVFADPRHEVVLEGPLDDLMKEVRREELVDIRSRKVEGERLCHVFSYTRIRESRQVLTVTSERIPYSSHKTPAERRSCWQSVHFRERRRALG